MYKLYLQGVYKDRPIKRKRFNFYGYWEFTDILGIGGEEGSIEQGDFIYVFSKDGDMVKGWDIAGKEVSFHYTNITKNYFVRPDTINNDSLQKLRTIVNRRK